MLAALRTACSTQRNVPLKLFPALPCLTERLHLQEMLTPGQLPVTGKSSVSTGPPHKCGPRTSACRGLLSLVLSVWQSQPMLLECVRNTDQRPREGFFRSESRPQGSASRGMRPLKRHTRPFVRWVRLHMPGGHVQSASYLFQLDVSVKLCLHPLKDKSLGPHIYYV